MSTTALTTPTGTAARLTAEALSYRYPDGTVALRDVSLTVAPGEIVAVLGPSGSGKSTLMRCLAGLHVPTSGTVRHDGTDITRLRGRARRRALARCGLIFQEFELVAPATALSNVLIGRLIQQPALPSLLHLVRRTDREIAVRALLRVGMEPQLRKRADSLSGGQRQRVAIARALAQQPDVLLADEPVANLDPRTAASVVDQIVALAKEEKLATVLNLHDTTLATRIADRIVGLRDGRVVADEPVDAVDDVLLGRLYAGEQT